MLPKPSFLPEKPLQASTSMIHSTVDQRRHAELIQKLQRLTGSECPLDTSMLSQTSTMANLSSSTNVGLNLGMAASANGGGTTIGIGIGAGINPNVLSSSASYSSSMANNNNPPIVNTGNNGPMCVQPGDWMCSSCGFVNWRRRKVCMRCYPFADSNEISCSIASGALLAAQLAAGVELHSSSASSPAAARQVEALPFETSDKAASVRSVSSNSGNNNRKTSVSNFASLPMRPDLRSTRQHTMPNWLPSQGQHRRLEDMPPTSYDHVRDAPALDRHVSLHQHAKNHHQNSSRSTADNFIADPASMLRAKPSFSSLSFPALPHDFSGGSIMQQPQMASNMSYLPDGSSSNAALRPTNFSSIWRFPSPSPSPSPAIGAGQSSSSSSSSRNDPALSTILPSTVYRPYKATTIFADSAPTSTSTSPSAAFLTPRHQQDNINNNSINSITTTTTTSPSSRAHSPSPWPSRGRINAEIDSQSTMLQQSSPRHLPFLGQHDK